MASTPDELREMPPPELVERATALVRSHPECFWFWHPKARIKDLEDVRLVVERLREYGDHRAWAGGRNPFGIAGRQRAAREFIRPLRLKPAFG